MEALPTAFIGRIKSDSFWDDKLLSALDDSSPISIRLNPNKTKPLYPLDRSVSWCEGAYYLPKRPVYTLDPLFHSGCYYPQEAGSMFIQSILQQIEVSKSSIILDLCAAPGGKSTLLNSFLDEQGFLVSNEIIPTRNVILRENLSKWGCANVVVTGNQPIHFQRIPSFFDLVLVDAPCSGEGMFRKDPDSRKEWSMDNVDMCESRQKDIVSDVWDALKEHGYLIYSTCTLNQQENEDNVNWICENLNAEIISLNIPTGAISGRGNVGCYFAPGSTQSEGFYCAVLRKKSTIASGKKIRSRLKVLPNQIFQKFDSLVKKDDLVAIEYKNGVSVFQKSHLTTVETLDFFMNCTKIGVAIGTIFPNKIEPNHELALSKIRHADIPTIELTKEMALHYLKGETFPISSVHKGYYLMTYQNEPLGWINHLGNRFNNLYPKEWRIRMKID